MDLDALPPSIASRIVKLERQVEILQRSNKLLASTITGGVLRILDEDGTRIALIGELSAGVNGLRVYASNGTTPILQVDQVGGFGLPWISTSWRPYEDTDVTHTTEGAGEVVNSTFRRIWRTTTELLYATDMLFRVIITCPVGSTGELRVYHLNSAAQLGGTLTVASGTTAATQEFRYQHGQTIGTGPHHFYLEGRVTSGAGPLTVYWPAALHYGTNMTPDPDGWV